MAAATARRVPMRRIVIPGNAGRGQSTLVRALGQQPALPVVHLNRLLRESGWAKADTEVFRSRIRQAISCDGWIREGNHRCQSFDLRLPRADLVIWVETSRVKCLLRIAMRSALNRPRSNLPNGCVERLDADFVSRLRYVWNFDRGSRPDTEKQRFAQGARVPVVRLRGVAQTAKLLRLLS